MTERSELLALPARGVEQPIGELALRPREAQDLFGVTSEEIIALAPSTVEGGQAFLNVVLAMNPNEKRLHGEQEPESGKQNEPEDQLMATLTEEEPDEPGYGRAMMRKSKSQYGSYLVKLIQTGAQYLATFDDPEEGIQAGRQILPEETDKALGDLYTKRVVPAAEPMRYLHRAARTTLIEARTVLAAEGEEATANRYTLLKAFGYDRYQNKTNYDKQKARIEKPEPEFVLTAFHAMEGGDVHKQLISELQAGAYDQLIARDILRFLHGTQEVEGDLSKVQQLVKCVYFISGQPADADGFYKLMVDNLDMWPVAQRQVISDARAFLRDRLESRLKRISFALREDDFIVDNPREAFSASFGRLADVMLKRIPVTPQNRRIVMQLRAQAASAKRGRATPRREERRSARRGKNGAKEITASEVEGPREPSKIVACNLNNYSINEDPSSMIDTFVEGASQGNITIREDINRMLNFMARRDLPPAHRRGIKVINGSKVKFGLEDDPDKLWDFYEFKPTEAAGLSLRTNVARNTRVYFIKIDADTIGIIGIQPRTKQDEFLRAIRVKSKRRGDET